MSELTPLAWNEPVHSLIDLGQANGLFLGGRRDLADQIVDLGHLGQDLAQRVAGLADPFDVLPTWSVEARIRPLISLAALAEPWP
jgi:hypothetical protein